MSSFIIAISRTIFFRLLARAPEDLQRKAKENARGAIPALRLHGRRHQEKVRARGAMGRADRGGTARGRSTTDGCG